VGAERCTLEEAIASATYHPVEDALRAQLAAIPWDTLRAMRRVVQRSGVIDPDDTESFDVWLREHGPREADNER
jgi:DNA-binding transcriptional regulator YdaS (Cro superfamily)